MDFRSYYLHVPIKLPGRKLQTKFRYSRAQKKIINYSKLNKEQNREFVEILTPGVIATSPSTCPLHHQDHRNQCQLVHQVTVPATLFFTR